MEVGHGVIIKGCGQGLLGRFRFLIVKNVGGGVRASYTARVAFGLSETYAMYRIVDRTAAEVSLATRLSVH